MKILSILHSHPFFFFFFFVFFSVNGISMAISASPPSFIPDVNITLDCGSSVSGKAADGREWMAEIGSKFAPNEEPKSNSSSTAVIALIQGSSVSDIPYMTARLSWSQFTYSLPVTPGPKFIRLYFYPSTYPGFNSSSSNAFFTVKAGSFTLLKNFSASLTSEFLDKEAFWREYYVNVEDNQKLEISFIPSPHSYAFVNGIEVVSMPADLYYSPPGRDTARYIGTTSRFEVGTKFALETVHRLNIGAGLIQAKDDTGMFRNWLPGNDFVLGPGVMTVNSTILIKFTMIQNYTAPEDLYKTAVSMGPNGRDNLKRNLTVRLPVDSGFMYLVRLHFCEFSLEVTKENDRIFNVYLNQQTDGEFVDVIGLSKGLGSPVFKDYVLIVGLMGVPGRSNLTIDFHPIESIFADAIINGIEVLKLSYQDNLAGLNPDPILTPPLQPTTLLPTKSSKKSISIAVGVIMSLVLVLCFLGYLILWRLRKRGYKVLSFLPPWFWCWQVTEKGKSARTNASSTLLPEEQCRRFSLADIREATNDFNPKFVVGVGGFGSVYRGYIEKEGRTFAIKRSNAKSGPGRRSNGKAGQGEREFKTEIELLSNLRHKHLVSLLGYCIEEGEMLLVYEFMEKGTLRQHLYETNNDLLPWKKRLEICLGAARGLCYLHTGVEQTIIHRDVKTTNILLDDQLVAKVSDFGLSKIGLNNTAVSTNVKGTHGYLDPEYMRLSMVSEKSDVYSFGVVLFEVLCARKALDQKLEDHEQCNLALWARKCIENGTMHQIIDPYLMGKIAPECFKRYVELAESCIRDHVNDRPSMDDVMERLDFILKLQENADAASEEIAPGSGYLYPEVLFRIPSSNNTSLYNVVDESYVSDYTGTDFTSTTMLTSGVTFVSAESNSATSGPTFTAGHQ